ncbi:hypothetical protein FYK26_03330 [Escherichia albertii]|nr:hypothetical protein FYK29_03345 [Escherichia albertii]QTA04692.1 hypothetical protein FYK26_03330 [Escherichia albertii]
MPLALISTEGATEWCAEYDEWGNLLNEENPHQLQQLIRLPGQQYDEESGLYYNRHRYYDPLQGRYITQDPIGLKGGWYFYRYPLNPVAYTDALGLYSNWGEFMNNSMYNNNAPSDVTSKIYNTPFPGSGSIDISFNGDEFTGASFAVGATVGGNDSVPANLDVCVYYTLCKHNGVGSAIGISLSGTASQAKISPGEYLTKGYISTGGYLKKYSIAGVRDADGKYSGTVSIGPGFGGFVGELTCSQSLWCLSQLAGY